MPKILNAEEIVKEMRENNDIDAQESDDSMYESDEDVEMEKSKQSEQILHKFLMDKANEEAMKCSQIDYYEILKELEQADLPEIPEFVIEKQVNPPPYDQPRIIFGKKSLLPKKEEDDKKAKQKKSKVKLPKKKKGEKAPHIYPFKEFPPRKPDLEQNDYF